MELAKSSELYKLLNVLRRQIFRYHDNYMKFIISEKKAKKIVNKEMGIEPERPKPRL